nr:unnamed protein product [Papilio xuthus]
MKIPMAYVIETRIGIGVLILWALLAVMIIWRKFFTAVGNDEDYFKYLEIGKKLKKRRNYDEAIKILWQALRKSKEFIDFRDVYNELGACYYEKLDYENALTMFNISLDLKITNLTALKWRSMCLAKLGMYEQAYEDASIYDVLIKGSNSFPIENAYCDIKTIDLFNLVMNERMRRFFKENQTNFSNLRYSRFYSSFNKIIPQDVEDHGDLVWILKSKCYDKLFEFFFGDQCIKNKQKFIEKYGTEGLFSYDLIHCTVQCLRGNFEDCVKILENPKTELEFVFGDQIRKIYAFKKTIEIDPTFHEAYLQLGIYYGEKDPVSGLQYLRDSLKIVSCHDEAREIGQIVNNHKIKPSGIQLKENDAANKQASNIIWDKSFPRPYFYLVEFKKSSLDKK